MEHARRDCPVVYSLKLDDTSAGLGNGFTDGTSFISVVRTFYSPFMQYLNLYPYAKLPMQDNQYYKFKLV